MTVYKFLSILLGVAIAVGGVFYAFERHSNASKRRELTNQIAELEGTIQETETAYSRRAVEVNNLKLANKELQTKIKDRDEEAVALSEATLRWKNKYLKATKVSESLSFSDPKKLEEVVNELLNCEASSNADLDVRAFCEAVWEQARVRVDFETEDDPLRVYGFTISNPAEAEVNIEWQRDIKLSLILTKDKDDLFRVYLDTDSADLIPAELKLSVDPSILDRKWYEKISMGSDITVGEGLVSSYKIMYDVFENWSLGPVVMLNYDGVKLRKTFGVSTLWYPFR